MRTPREILTDLSSVYTNYEKHIDRALAELAEWIRSRKFGEPDHPINQALEDLAKECEGKI